METLSEFETYEQPIPRIVIPILGNADADSGAHRPRPKSSHLRRVPNT